MWNTVLCVLSFLPLNLQALEMVDCMIYYIFFSRFYTETLYLMPHRFCFSD